ncbi:hypothetical protein EON63_08600 [archaeon]|nr:MAG: hypothetical protein EON63_08600 [archaeon]
MHSSPKVDAKTQSAVPMMPSRCPFHQAKAFLARPTALMATSLSLCVQGEGGVSTSTSPHLSRREVKMLASRRFPQLQSLSGYSYVTYTPSHSSSYTILHASPSITPITHPSPSSRVTADQPVASDGPSEQPRGGKAGKKKKGGEEALEVVVIGLSHHNAKVEVSNSYATFS